MFVTVKIAFNITVGQMMCTSCTSGVKAAISAVLKIDNQGIDTKTTTINAYDCNAGELHDIIIIDQIRLLNSLDILLRFRKTLQKVIEQQGFDCENYVIYVNQKKVNIEISANVDVEIGSKKITDYILEDSALPSPLLSKKSLWGDVIVGSGMLTLGTTLMILEHLNKIENPIIELSVGSVSTAITLIAGRKYIQNALKRQGAMDTLITLGSGGAILYSFLLILQPPFLKDDTSSSFFDVPLMILGFLKLSHALRKIIENKIKSQENMVEEIKNNLPQNIKTTSKETIPVNDVNPGTLILVNPGEVIPIDSKLTQLAGTICVNEKLLSGNDQEKIKRNGDILYAGTKNNTNEILTLETICLFHENQIYIILHTIQSTSKDDDIIEWVVKYFLRGVLSIATISSICWGLFGPAPAVSNAIQVFLAVILSACPCGLGLIDLNETMIKLIALEQGIIIQSKKALLTMAQVTDICIDKCGTSTTGQYTFKNITVLSGNIDKETLLDYAIALQRAIPEEDQTALGKAILTQTPNQQYKATHYLAYAANRGRGGQIQIDGHVFTMGNQALLNSFSISLPPGSSTLSHKEDVMTLYCAIDGNVVGYIQLQPTHEEQQTLRPDFLQNLHLLIKEKKSIHILTGDDSVNNAKTMAEQLISHIDIGVQITQKDKPTIVLGNQDSPILHINIGLLPKDKVTYIKTLQTFHKKVVMLGDGTNDIGAIEAADVGAVIDNDAPARVKSDVILNGKFSSLIQLISLSTSYGDAYRTSIGVAFGTNAGLISASAGVFYPLTKQIVDPMIIGMGMASSSLLVIGTIFCWKQIAHKRVNNISSHWNLSNYAKHSTNDNQNPIMRRLMTYPES